MRLKAAFSSSKLWPKQFLTEKAEISAMKELAVELQREDTVVRIGRFKVATISEVVLKDGDKTIEFEIHFIENKIDIWTLV